MKTIYKIMSNSLASAKRRRANMQPETSTPTPSPAPSQPQPQPQQSKMTIPAYLSLILEGLKGNTISFSTVQRKITET